MRLLKVGVWRVFTKLGQSYLRSQASNKGSCYCKVGSDLTLQVSVARIALSIFLVEAREIRVLSLKTFDPCIIFLEIEQVYLIL